MAWGPLSGSSSQVITSAGAAAPAYDADEIYTSRKWFEAYYLTGFSDNDPISTLEDLGSDGVDLTQTTTKRPTYKTDQSNGFPAISLDGGDSMVTPTTWATSGDFTICQRFKVGAAALNGNMANWAENAAWTHYQSGLSNHQVYSGGAANFNKGYNANTFYTTILVRDGSYLSLYVDGSVIDTVGWTANVSVRGLWGDHNGSFPMEASLIFVHAVYTQAFSSANQLAWHNGYSGVYN